MVESGYGNAGHKPCPRIGQNKKGLCLQVYFSRDNRRENSKTSGKKTEFAEEFINNNNPLKMLSRENISNCWNKEYRKQKAEDRQRKKRKDKKKEDKFT